MSHPITILICALGGEGGGVLAEWLYGAAARGGHAAQATSVPGVAQRTGATTYYIEIAPEPLVPGAARPVFSLSPVPGCVDLLVSSELLETVRQASAGFVSRERTRVVSSTARALTVAEKMGMGDGRVDTAALVAVLQRQARALELFDFNALAREAGTVISAVLLGAVAASGVLPMPRSAYEEAIRAAGKGVQASLAGFALAFDAMTKRQAQQREAVALLGTLAGAGARGAADGPQAGASPSDASVEAVSRSAQPAHGADPSTPQGLRALARSRVAAYQDEAYARLFDERLARLARTEDAAQAAGAGAGQGGVGGTGEPGAARAALADRSSTSVSATSATPVTDEATRWLALWMCFDDIVQVAGLKLAASRMARVRREVNAAPGDIVKTFDHFKPGVPELAGLLPPALADRLLAWDRRRVAAGREPWSMPLKLGTHGVVGVLALRCVAAMKGQRRRGRRYAEEQALIERWLAAVDRGTREAPALGLELARCGALVKGYGSTNERGKENLAHIVGHLAFAAGRSAEERTEAVRAARAAATADDAGRALDATLVAHGAPARPPREQVVRWFKRRPESQPASVTAGR